MKIDILRMDGMAAACQAWQNSRTLYPKEHEMAVLDAPVAEMPTCMLHFQDMTVLEREIFTSARNHVVWARTSRVDDPSAFSIPEEFINVVNEDLHCELRSKMLTEAKAGVHQDEWRMQLPLSACTSWTARMSYRDVVRWCTYFTYLSHYTKFITPLRLRFGRIAGLLFEVMLAFVPDTNVAAKSVDTAKLVPILYEYELPGDQHLTHTSQITTMRCVVPVGLRAQLVRHRQLQFVDTLFYLMQRTDILDQTLASTVAMELTATSAQWKDIIGKRSCWIAHHELWAPVVGLFGQATLPCADGRCPYSKDAELRFTSADPGVPCPRYCNLNDINKRAWQAEMRASAATRSKFWMDEVNK